MQRQNPSSGPVQAAGRPAITTHDRLWAEMQLKLEDIELSASASRGTGAIPALGHGNTALEELRVAQVALAQAWRRNKEDNTDADARDGTADHHPQAGGGRSEVDQNDASLKAEDRATSSGTATSAVPGLSSTEERVSADIKPFYMEDKTHADIQSARKRREANDEHFSKVSKGVLDVVQKLDTVAKSMIVVEEATKEIWASNNNNNTGDSTSLSGESAAPVATTTTR